MQQWPMLLSTDVFSKHRDREHQSATALPLPPLCPSPVKCTLTLFSLTAGSFGTKAERKLLLCSSRALFARLACLAFEGFWWVWLISHRLAFLVYSKASSLTFHLPLPTTTKCTLCIYISINQRDLIKDPEQQSPHPHGHWKFPLGFLMSFKKIKIKKEIKFIHYK